SPRRFARGQFLNPKRARAASHAAKGRALMETLLQDIRFGFRQLMKQPGFAALAIISMALGIGANTSIFSLVDTALLRPLAVKEVLGRAFFPEEDQTPDSHPVAVISYNCWQHRFGADPHVVGKTVEFNSRPFTIIGVAPKGFIGTEVAYDPEMFIPVMMAKTIEPGSRWLDKRDSNNLFTVGRLKPGVSFAQALSALETLTVNL